MAPGGLGAISCFNEFERVPRIGTDVCTVDLGVVNEKVAKAGAFGAGNPSSAIAPTSAHSVMVPGPVSVWVNPVVLSVNVDEVRAPVADADTVMRSFGFTAVLSTVFTPLTKILAV